jgi:hypothetical protein
MYVPFGSERSAFWFAIGAAALLAISVTIGALTVPMAGVDVLAVGLFLTALVYTIRRDPRRPLELLEAAHAAHSNRPTPGNPHLLVVANQTLAGAGLADEITLEAGMAELIILAPVRASRTHYLFSDIDRELDEARARLRASLVWAAAHGFDATGEVTDPNPMRTIIEKLEDFGPQAVVFVRHPTDRATWLDNRELWRMKAELDIPIKEIPSAVVASASETARPRSAGR